MDIILVRHGIAISRDDPECPPDPERPLTSKGIRRTRGAMLGLQSLVSVPDLILSSPYVRAMQTAEIVRECLAPSLAVNMNPSFLPFSDPQESIEILLGQSVPTVVCVGHAPNLDFIVSAVTQSNDDMSMALKKSGVAKLSVDEAGVRVSDFFNGAKGFQH